MALHRPQGVGVHVFTRHKPGLVLSHTALAPRMCGFKVCAFGFHAANAQSLALPQRVKTQANVFTHHAACVAFNQAGSLGDVAV